MPKHDPSERTKSEILQTALRLFKEKGWENVNIEDVVREVGVTRGAFYHYFKSRETLVAEVVELMFLENNAFTHASEQMGLDALGKMRFAFKHSIGFNTENVGMVNALQKAMEHPVVFKSEFFSQIHTVAPYLEKLLKEGNEDGSLNVKFPKQAAQAICLLSGMWLSHDVKDVSRDEFIERLSFMEHTLNLLGIPLKISELDELLTKLYDTVA